MASSGPVPVQKGLLKRAAPDDGRAPEGAPSAPSLLGVGAVALTGRGGLEPAAGTACPQGLSAGEWGTESPGPAARGGNTQATAVHVQPRQL